MVFETSKATETCSNIKGKKTDSEGFTVKAM
ncbi:hypothetical protein XELAEV_180290722mg, partial [Xenopus laevis]